MQSGKIVETELFVARNTSRFVSRRDSRKVFKRTMAERTEAACLLETGASYSRRIGLKNVEGAIVFAGFKHGGFSIYHDDAPLFHFDLEGRWQRAFIDGIHDVKGLDGSIDALERPREGVAMVLRRRRLSFAEGADLDAFIRESCLKLIEDIHSGRFEPIMPPAFAKFLSPEDLLEFLEKIVSWDSSAWFKNREGYLAAYGPLPFLPPDGQNSLILQATIGHAEGVSFGLAPREEHVVRSPGELSEHLRDVRKFLGKRLSQCRGVFLGGSDLLRRPAEEVESALNAIATEFPIDPDTKGRRLTELAEDQPRLSGISTFLDDFRDPLPNSSALKSFRDLHLRRVFLGIESGDPEIRSLFGKSWTDDSLRALTANLKGNGIELSILILDAPGGLERRTSHIAKTVDLLSKLELARGDLVYLLDANEVGGETFRAALLSHGLTPAPRTFDGLSPFKQALVPFGIKMLSYSLEKQGGNLAS